jgi:hypothetical protein
VVLLPVVSVAQEDHLGTSRCLAERQPRVERDARVGGQQLVAVADRAGDRQHRLTGLAQHQRTRAGTERRHGSLEHDALDVGRRAHRAELGRHRLQAQQARGAEARQLPLAHETLDEQRRQHGQQHPDNGGDPAQVLAEAGRERCRSAHHEQQGPGAVRDTDRRRAAGDRQVGQVRLDQLRRPRRRAEVEGVVHAGVAGARGDRRPAVRRQRALPDDDVRRAR